MFWTTIANLLLSIGTWLFKLEAAPVAAQASETGVAQEAAAQAVLGEKAAESELAASVNAPKDVAGVAKELDDGRF